MANVLVVEDDRLNRNLICKVLRNEGHQVFEASEGAEALELLYAQRFDLVITDFVMPRLNGLKFADRGRGAIEARPSDMTRRRDRARDR